MDPVINAALPPVQAVGQTGTDPAFQASLDRASSTTATPTSSTTVADGEIPEEAYVAVGAAVLVVVIPMFMQQVGEAAKAFEGIDD
jgi:hypothetical protein